MEHKDEFFKVSVFEFTLQLQYGRYKLDVSAIANNEEEARQCIRNRMQEVGIPTLGIMLRRIIPITSIPQIVYSEQADQLKVIKQILPIRRKPCPTDVSLEDAKNTLIRTLSNQQTNSEFVHDFTPQELADYYKAFWKYDSVVVVDNRLQVTEKEMEDAS